MEVSVSERRNSRLEHSMGLASEQGWDGWVGTGRLEHNIPSEPRGLKRPPDWVRAIDFGLWFTILNCGLICYLIKSIKVLG